MPTYEITTPDGRKIRVTGNGTKEEALAQVQAQYQARPREFVGPTEEQARQPTSLGRQVMRGQGLGARNLAQGAMDIVAPFADLTGNVLNAALPGRPFNTQHSQSFGDLLTRTGLPRPETTGERVAELGGRMVPGILAGGAIDRAVLGGLGLTRGAAAQQSVPTSEQLKNLSHSAYQQAEAAGVVIAPNSFANSVGKIVGSAAKEGIDPTLHPQATAALKRLTDVVSEGRPIALQELETLRKVAKGAAGSISKDERRIARLLVDGLDDYAMRLTAGDVVAGNAPGAGQLLRNARDLWSKASKSDVVDELVERANTRASQFSGSGYENALRTEFRSLVLNPKRLRVFTPVEQEALKKVARGGPVENVLRYLGKLAPTGVVSGALSGGIGAAIAGPVGAVAVPVAGFAARQGATQLTARNARLAGELMRRGAQPAAQSAQNVAPALGAAPSFYEWLMEQRNADR